MFTTFVINLDKDTERMSYMDSQLKRAGILYRRKEAILGREYTPSVSEYDENIAVTQSGYRMSPGELGCALSHAKVIKDIVNEKIPYSLILEDDVTIPQNFSEIVENVIKKDKNWEYVLFDYIPVGLPFFRQWLVGVKLNYKKKKNLNDKILFFVAHVVKGVYIFTLSLFEKIREFVRVSNPGPVTFFRPVYFAGAYLVNYEGAKKLYDLTNPVIFTADQVPNKARVLKNLKFKCFSPLVVRQEKQRFGSSILNIKGEEIFLAYENK